MHTSAWAAGDFKERGGGFRDGDPANPSGGGCIRLKNLVAVKRGGKREFFDREHFGGPAGEARGKKTKTP